MGTPGLRLIQDLLAKSVAKWSGDAVVKTECSHGNGEIISRNIKVKPSNILLENKLLAASAPSNHGAELSGYINTKDGKRKRTDDHVHRKKKKVGSKYIEDEDFQHIFVKKEVKELKEEYTEPETVVDIPIGDPSTFSENAKEESLIKRLLKISVAKYRDLNQKENLERNLILKSEIKEEKVERNLVLKLEKKKEYVEQDLFLQSEIKLEEVEIDLIPKLERKKDPKSEILGDLTPKSDTKKKIKRNPNLKLEVRNASMELGNEYDNKSKVLKEVQESNTKKGSSNDITDKCEVEAGKNMKRRFKKSKLKCAEEVTRRVICERGTETNILKYKKVVRFSPEEDKIIRNALETGGDNINISELAKDIGRHPTSVNSRIKILKSVKKKIVQKPYSLIEDQVIMETVLKDLHGQTLKELTLHSGGDTQVIATGLGRSGNDLFTRWSCQLKLWILQHYSGTLNLDIRRMLANHLNETYDSIDSIDWTAVSKTAEFVGHTHRSLKFLFNSTLIKSAQRREKLERAEITLDKIADNANVHFTDKKLNVKVLVRQKQVIDYFEQFVKKNDITNFL